MVKSEVNDQNSNEIGCQKNVKWMVKCQGVNCQINKLLSKDIRKN